MRLDISSIALSLSLFLGHSDAFQPTKLAAPRCSSSALASYLDSLSGGAVAEPSTPPPSHVSSGAAPNGPIYSTPGESTAAASSPFSYAPIEYFDVANMSSKGPRGTADWGTPQDATRKLDDDGTFRVGAWYCSEGGWPSPNPKAHTEVFYVLDGHGCLGDADGTKHYFGPGDTVIIPKGHTGRWDVFTPIHKVWAVNDHERIEETSDPIRVSVTHYHNFAPEQMNAAEANDPQPFYGGTSLTFYDVGPTKVGAWTGSAGSSFPVDNGSKRSFFHMLEGVLFVTDSADGSARRCVAGDTVMLPAGFSGHIDVIETAKKVWTDGL